MMTDDFVSSLFQGEPPKAKQHIFVFRHTFKMTELLGYPPLPEQIEQGGFKCVEPLLLETAVLEPVLNQLGRDGVLELLALPDGMTPERMTVSMVPPMLERYQFIGIGLRLLLSLTDNFARCFWEGELRCFPAFGSPVGPAGFERFPVVSLATVNGVLCREICLVSRYSPLRHRSWLFPAVNRWCVS